MHAAIGTRVAFMNVDKTDTSVTFAIYKFIVNVYEL